MYSLYRQFIFSTCISSSPQLGDVELPIYEGRMRVPGKIDRGHSQIRSWRLTNLVRLLPSRFSVDSFIYTRLIAHCLS